MTPDFRVGWYSQESPSPFGLFLFLEIKFAKRFCFMKLVSAGEYFCLFFMEILWIQWMFFFSGFIQISPDFSRFLQISPDFSRFFRNSKIQKIKSKKKKFRQKILVHENVFGWRIFLELFYFFIFMKIHGKFMENSWKIHD